MDTQVNGTNVLVRKLGNLPEVAVSFGEANVTPLTGFRMSALRFKTPKTGSKRESMSVSVKQMNPDEFTGNEGHKFMSDLLNDYQDKLTKLCADGMVSWEVVNDQSKMIADYNDTSRDSSGRKVTKESIATWFIENCTMYITSAALAKNAQMKQETLENVVKGYAEMFGRLTKYDLVTVFTEPQLILVKRILANVPAIDGDEMRQWIDDKMLKIDVATAAIAALADAI